MNGHKEMLTTYIVDYDLRKPGQKYDALFEKLKGYPWCHQLKSSWLIVTGKTASQLLDDLRTVMDANDLIFVGKVSGTNDWSSYNTSKVNTWLNGHMGVYVPAA
jgi:hypothetical protein